MRIFFTLSILLTVVIAYGQNTAAVALSRAVVNHGQSKTTGKDTVIEKDTSKENQEPQYFYISGNINVFVNTKGGFAKRFSPSVEFGRTYGIFDIGLATGRFNSVGGSTDTVRYIEFRPTINIFSKGRFAEGLCLGGGYVFGAKQGLMTEICNSINFNVTTTVALAIVQGYYFLDGTNSSHSSQYMGFNLTYNFLKKHSVNNRRKLKAIISDN
jgi:hypothetical protein